MITKNTDQIRQCVDKHVAADSIIQRNYWDDVSLRGCFIGCLAHGDDPSANAATYGLPVTLQRIAENVFKALPIEEAKKFFAALPDSIRCDGKDLSKVHWQFLAAELRSLPPQPDAAQVVIDPVIAGIDRLAAGREWPAAAARAAARVAWAARAAAWAAAHVAWAAAAAHVDAADARAARLRQRDLLLKLIADAPVLEGVHS